MLGFTHPPPPVGPDQARGGKLLSLRVVSSIAFSAHVGSRPIPCRGFVTLRYAASTRRTHGLDIEGIELTKEQDKEYLSPIIRQVESESKEREDLDNLVIKR